MDPVVVEPFIKVFFSSSYLTRYRVSGDAAIHVVN
jgi:hypothetical protein